MDIYDVAVLGAGPGGYVAALRAALRGAKVCCIEAKQIGGACLNVGCIPTKAMLHASELFWQMGRAGEFGLTAGERGVDGAAYMQRVAKVVSELRRGVEGLLKTRKVDVIRGRGRLVAPDALSVEDGGDTTRVRARRIIIATGSRPSRPDFLPWECGRVITTDEATTAQTLPESVLIVGGGVIGCEFATVYSELGIPTTVVEMLDRLVPNLDNDASRAVARSLQRRRVQVHTGTKITGMKATDSGIVSELEEGPAIEAKCALIATGRPPNVEDLGLETVGVSVADGIIAVDDKCRTNVEGIYAIGDVAEARQYAHLASRMGIVAADHATGHPAEEPRTVVPVGMFTHPEVATVGLSEAEAGGQSDEVRVARFPYRASGMARAYGETEGEVKIIAETASGRILGAVVIGRHATEVIQEIAVAMRSGVGVHDLAETIHPHPTFAEAVLEASELWLGLPTHVPR